MDNLKICTSFREVISPLNDAEKGRLFDAMLMYADSGEEPDFKGNERFIWPAVKQDIDRATQKAETLRQNGNKGGRPSKPKETKENQTKPNGTKENQTKANITKANQSEPKETKDEAREESVPSPLTPPSPPSSLSPTPSIPITPITPIIPSSPKEESAARKRFTPPTVDEVTAYCRERENHVDAQKFVDFYTSKGWKVGDQGMKDWKACVRTWERKDSGGFAPKKVSAQAYGQRQYSEEELLSVSDDLMEEARRRRDGDRSVG